MGICEYISAQRQNSDKIQREASCFGAIIVPFDALYEKATKLVPKDTPLIFDKLLLLSHRSFLAGAALIAQAQPDDAAPISRRAAEMAKFALAYKRNPANADRWLAHEQRAARWAARQAGRKPGRAVTPQYDHSDEPLLRELDSNIGILSDAHVHFTPEFLGNQHWDITEGEPAPFLFHSYFVEEPDAITRAFLFLVACHMTILRVFDVCLCGALMSCPDWVTEFRNISGHAAVAMAAARRRSLD